MFFIPCIKWNKHYYVRTSCCNTLYELDPEMGKAIARGEQVLIRPEHLQRISKVTYGYNYKLILSILVDTFISKISFPMQPGPEIGSISDA